MNKKKLNNIDIVRLCNSYYLNSDDDYIPFIKREVSHMNGSLEFMNGIWDGDCDPNEIIECRYPDRDLSKVGYVSGIYQDIYDYYYILNPSDETLRDALPRNYSALLQHGKNLCDLLLNELDAPFWIGQNWDFLNSFTGDYLYDDVLVYNDVPSDNGKLSLSITANINIGIISFNILDKALSRRNEY